MQTARDRWTADYRAARSLTRFFSATGYLGNPSLPYPATLLQFPSFCHTRLFGDHLHLLAGHLGQVTHLARMGRLRQRVRLPR